MVESSETTRVEEILEKVRKIKEKYKEDRELLLVLNSVEELLKDTDFLTVEAIKTAVKGKSEKEVKSFGERLMRQPEVRKVFTREEKISRSVATLVFAGWIMAAGMFFILGLYLFFPPYMLFTQMHANATILQETLKAIYSDPQVLTVADMLFKLLGILMMIMSVVSMHQAHIWLGKLGRE